VNYKAGENH
jgi:hypothetical protein